MSTNPTTAPEMYIDPSQLLRIGMTLAEAQEAMHGGLKPATDDQTWRCVVHGGPGWFWSVSVSIVNGVVDTWTCSSPDRED